MAGWMNIPNESMFHLSIPTETGVGESEDRACPGLKS